MPAAVIIFAAYFIRGIAGFGSGLIAIPLLAQLLPLTIVVPIILITDFSASFGLGIHTRKQVRWDEIRPLLIFGILGVGVGTTLLIKLPLTPLLVTLGLVVLVFGIRSLLNIQGTRKVARWWAGPAGFIGGTISALFGTGGPPYVIYLNHRLQDKAELRASFTWLFLIEGGARVVTFVIAGLLLDVELIMAILAALPLVALGLYAGNRVHLGVTSEHMQRLIGAILVISGAALLWRAWP